MDFQKRRLQEDYVKYLIWNFYSKTNKRPFYGKNFEKNITTKQDKENWKKIKNQVF